MNNNIDWQRFVQQIQASRKFLLTAHHRPDGDCIGSELAMYRILTRLGKEVRIVNPHQTPPNLQFLDPDSLICPLKNLTDEVQHWLDTADTYFVLDTSSWQQLGDFAPFFKKSKAKKLVLDHHVKGDDLGAEMFIDDNAEATGTLVVLAAEALGVPLTLDIAEPAFVAVATDTGWFRFSNVKAETFRIAAKLLDAGVKQDELYQKLYEQESLPRLRLVGRTLAKSEPYLDGQILITWILREDFDAVGAKASDSEDIINELLKVQGTQMAALISELKTGGFKASFRSRCSVDCSVLARNFGGGGHQKAAGASFNVSFEETKKAVVEAIIAAMQE
ncbi:phosphodiesterase [Planctomycetales bacterium]|nr:phosphodiesterase [Planctomycetales bacterium]